jgi:hypothetical protein
MRSMIERGRIMQMRYPKAPSGRLKWSMVAASTLLAAVAVAAGPVAASGPVVTVAPTGPLPAAAQTVTVTGAGFDPVGNEGNGVYVVFGPITPAPGYYMDPSVYAAFKWVYPAGAESPASAPMATDGTFSTTLDIPSSFTSPTGQVDCATVACAVITFGAHGSQDRSQDTCTLVTFAPGGASASMAPGTSGAPVASAAAPSMTAPSGSMVPAASGAPGDPCAAISTAAAP